jgi:hypothetical protein
VPNVYVEFNIPATFFICLQARLDRGKESEGKEMLDNLHNRIGNAARMMLGTETYIELVKCQGCVL